MLSILGLTFSDLTTTLGFPTQPITLKGDEGETTSKKEEKQPKVPSSIHKYQKGVYTVWEHVPVWSATLPGSSILRDLESFRAALPYVAILLRDLWNLSPLLCTSYIIANLLQSTIPAVKLAQTSRLLNLLENAMVTKQVDQDAFYFAIGLQIALTVLQWLVYSSQEWARPAIQQRFKYHFNQKMVSIRLRMDLPTSQSAEVKAKLSAAGTDGGSEAWRAFEKLVGLLETVVQILSTSGYMFGLMANQPGGNTVAILCLISPFINSFQVRRWAVIFYARVTNEAYKRMESLYSFAFSSRWKLEVLSNVAGDYVEEEYHRARAQFGNTSDDYPWGGETRYFSPSSLARDLIGDSGLILLAIKMVAAPGTIPLSSIAVMDQTINTFNSIVWSLMGDDTSIADIFMRVKAMYEVDQIVNKVQDGTERYPQEENKGKAMKVEFRNVFFKYPQAEAVDNVIDGLSFTISAGSICVIVGENGCGKSSTLKLLTRTYDVTEGQILIDDKPIQDYKLNDLRDASAIMHQDYVHFKLSIKENIGFGDIASINNMDAIKEAAKLGGADEFIEKLPSGYDTVMGEERDSISSGTPPEGSALDLMLKDQKEPPAAFSGGQTQRMALSRTFMRSMRDCVKLLAYDEPSAALDPKAEFALFEKLRSLKGNKTMLFITHRFGYLTKHADQIIYMEKGKVLEKGSHEELLALDGKYAHLYNVQAQAFL